MPIGYLGLRAIIWGLEEWFRKSELSCDRAGLLAGQDVDAARRALMKLAGGPYLSELNPDAFREQAHEYDAVPDLRDCDAEAAAAAGQHPPVRRRAVRRARPLGDGRCLRVGSSAGDYPRRDTDRDASVTDEMRNAANSYRDSWSRSEDPLVGHLPRRRGDRGPGGVRAVRPAQPATRRRHGRHGARAPAAGLAAAPATALATATTSILQVPPWLPRSARMNVTFIRAEWRSEPPVLGPRAGPHQPGGVRLRSRTLRFSCCYPRFCVISCS